MDEVLSQPADVLGLDPEFDQILTTASYPQICEPQQETKGPRLQAFLRWS